MEDLDEKGHSTASESDEEFKSLEEEKNEEKGEWTSQDFDKVLQRKPPSRKN